LLKEQQIEEVRHEECIRSAIERMIENEFSQLAVEADGKIIGLFTWRTYASRRT
jgi:predicted transcriptional regulator